MPETLLTVDFALARFAPLGRAHYVLRAAGKAGPSSARFSSHRRQPDEDAFGVDTAAGAAGA